MGKLFSDTIVTAIDIGTTKICVIMVRCYGKNQLEVIGIGKTASHGLQRGVVVDIAKTIQSIKIAVKEAELMAGMAIESAVIGISGSHIQSLNSQGIVPIKQGEIRSADIQQVIEASKAIVVPEGQRILHALPQYFIIDSNHKVDDPLGMHGVRLEVVTHIILGAVNSVRDLVGCCESAGITVSDIILEQLASAQAVLSPDEREVGVALLDIGGGTSDFAVYQNGTIRHSKVIPIAGAHFTNDLAVCLRTTVKEAERIKQNYGYAFEKLIVEDSSLAIEMIHGQQVTHTSRKDIAAILQPRAHELFLFVQQEIKRHRLAQYMPVGLVLTGGGSLLIGMSELAEQIFSFPVRIGTIQAENNIPESLKSPLYATSYGLILYALQKSKVEKEPVGISHDFSQSIITRMKLWIADFF